MWWGNDITKCPGGNCPYKEDCYRYTVKPDKWQSYADFSKLIDDGRKCEHFWPNDTSKDN